MASFLERLLGRAGGRGSGTTAKERLQFILVHDRISLPPEQLQAMKAEIMEVISKYVSIDRENVDIFLEQRDRESLIKAQIPFTGNPNQDEARRRLDSPVDNNIDDG